MRNAGLEEAQAGIKIAGSNINNLRYADDTTLTAESKEELNQHPSPRTVNTLWGFYHLGLCASHTGAQAGTQRLAERRSGKIVLKG